MVTLDYYIHLLMGKIRRDKHKETITKWFSKKGVLFPTGGPVYINSNIAKNEPHLISIGKNTTIAGEVEFVTHDNSVSKVIPNSTDLFGKITIGENCFIGARSVILYGVSIADNVIVAAGSVVTRSVHQSNVIVAGNPAKVISDWKSYKEKYEDFAWDLNSMNRDEMISKTSNGEKLVEK